MKVSFLTEELAFVDDQQCVQFISECGASHVFEKKDEGDLRLSCQKASPIFEAATAAANRVDIKGQI